jgi:hypothetical protein
MRIVRMKTDKLAKIQEYANAIAELLYEETAPEQVKTREGMEEAVRDHLLNYVNLQK